MKRLVFVFSFLFSFLSLTSYAAEPDWQTGDIIFHTSQSGQADSIIWATESPYSHVGIVEVAGAQKYVIEAVSPVSRTPLANWIRRGKNARYAVFRYRTGLSPRQQQAVLAAAKKYLGRPYDPYFTFNNTAIYCSELVWLAFQEAGIQLGRVERVKDLKIDGDLVMALAKKRWKQHPLCKGLRDFQQCWARVLEDELITPASLSRDNQLARTQNTYP